MKAYQSAPYPRAWSIGLVIIMMAVKTSAQSPTSFPTAPKSSDPSDLTQLRQQFALRALTSTRMLADQYTKALALLEGLAAAAGEYETALGAQQRRQQIAAWYATPAMDNMEAILLRPADAKITGTVSLDRNEAVLENWRTTACTASWDIFKLNSGTYTVTMTYGASGGGEGFGFSEGGAASGGEVEFSEISGLGGTEAEKLTARVMPTDGWKTYETLTMGEIKLTRTSARLTLKVTRLRGNSGLMHLREIRLSPAKPMAVKVDDTAAKEYAQQRQAHVERLAKLVQPIVDSYLSRLQSLSDDLGEKKDSDGQQALQNESRRVQQSLQLLGKETPVEPGTAISRPDGLDEIQDARYVTDPTNTGNRFLVSTKNQIISVRLMSVSCPSPGAEDEESQKYHSAYFGITLDDSVAVGRQAKEFTDTYLKDKPLRILTRWMRDKSGSILAIVQPGEVGDFSGILVDNGLAAITSPRAIHSERKRMEEAMLASLKVRETAAKAKALPPGAWSFLPATTNP